MAKVDYEEMLSALRQLSTALSQKQKIEDIDSSLWAKAGLKPKSRLKDVNDKITKTKGMISKKIQQEEAREEAQEAEGRVKFAVPGDAGASEPKAEKPSGSPAEKVDKRYQESKKVRQSGRDRKSGEQALARGDKDLSTDRMFFGEGGDITVMEKE